MNKVVLLVLLSLLMASCGGKKPNKPTNTGSNNNNNNNSTQVEDRSNRNRNTQTNSYTDDICCNSEDLSDSRSLLSKRVILFAYDQATVESQYRRLIAIHARYLSQNPSARIVLEGHADERGTPEYNLALGERRGKSVANLLRAQGASAGQISVVSFGEEKPVALCNNDSCWSQNRRVKIVYTHK